MIHVLAVEVTTPDGTDPAIVAAALNRALDEPPNDWRDWTVGTVVSTRTVAAHRCSNECEHAIRAIDTRNQGYQGGRSL